MGRPRAWGLRRGGGDGYESRGPYLRKVLGGGGGRRSPSYPFPLD